MLKNVLMCLGVGQGAHLLDNKMGSLGETLAGMVQEVIFSPKRMVVRENKLETHLIGITSD